MAACAALSFVAARGVHAQAPTPPAAQAPAVGVTLPGHVPALVNSSTLLGPVMGVQPVSLALTLPLRDTADLTVLLHDLYDTNNPLYGQYLTPQQFADRFGPTQADYDAVTQWAQAHGLTVTSTDPSRTILNVTASAATVQSAFNVHLLRYMDPTGREFYAPNTDPTIDPFLAGTLNGVIGLDNAAVLRPAGLSASPSATPGASPAGIGTDPHDGGLTPSDIKRAYNLSGTTLNGSGQSLAVFELGDLQTRDRQAIQTYEGQFGLPNVPVNLVRVDGGTSDTSAQDEVDGDIELQIALAPGASQIIVYSAPNTASDAATQYQRIASDGYAKEISSSWSFQENASNQLVDAENNAFKQMMAQGQTMFVASGDNGAYANGYYKDPNNYNNGTNPPAVYDPASQPFVCAVGGTSLTTNGGGGTWSSETTWMGTYQGTMKDSSGKPYNDGGSGGGISTIWPIPYYQSQPNIGSSQAMNSITYRNVPDVSLNADPNTGYSIYFNGEWQFYGGTSFAAPLWAAFTALVNQQRAANGYAPLGLANQSIYQIGLYTFGSYGDDFHDIATGNDLYYNAVPGYDLATGWGSFNGANLLADLAAPARTKSNDGPLYRLYNASNYGHAYTLDITEARSDMEGGDHYDGVACHVFFHPQDAPDLTPFYRTTSPSTGDNLYTIYQGEYQNSLNNGSRDGGIACYVFPDGSTPGCVPLYRTYSASSGQHFYTDNYTEYQNSVSNGGTRDGVVAYVLP